MPKTENPLLAPWKTPFESVPFAQIRKEHFIPALREAIRQAEARISQIKARPSRELSGASLREEFDAVVVGLETASERAMLIAGIFFSLLGADSDEELQAMARDISPLLAKFSSDIALDSEIFNKIKFIYDRRSELKLDAEETRLLEKGYRDFARNGALLDEAGKSHLRELDQKLSKLGPEFSDNVLKSTNAFEMWLESEADLAGLPADVREAAKLAASKAGKPDRWLFTLHGPSYVPFMTYSERGDLREKLWRGYNARAFGGVFDNQQITREIARLRFERAQLLGAKTHAHFVLAERMAETPERAIAFLDHLLEKSRPAAVRDLEETRAFKKAQTGDDSFASWDYGFWSEKLKRARYDFDQEALRPYFAVDKVVQGAFEHARRLYGVKFRPAAGIETYHPDVKVYEAIEEADGRHIGLIYCDLFPRPSKRGGAWMTGFRDQGLFEGTIRRPHVSIVCNFTPATDDKPSLLSFDETRTLFHEFGHSLHGLLSECRYPSVSGTSVLWDFVELPSQIMENWTLEKEALDLFASHWQTGEKIPLELTEKIKKAAKFQSGYQSMRQINFALLDMAWHAADPTSIGDISEFEARVTERTRLLPAVEGANLSCSFSHIFAGGYSAGYYSYKWAETLDADAFELFREKGLFDRETAASFRKNILSRGGSEHPMVLYKRFRGREPDPEALLRRDGLI